jgi:hypothetical protein
LLLLLCCASLGLAQGGTEPKPHAEDYDVHGQSKETAIGAEFMIHSFSGQGQTYIAPDFLVVEVALYPPKGQGVTVDEGAFALRINGKRQTLSPAVPSMVVSSLQHPDWRAAGPHLEAGGGLGNTGVILGRPAPTQVPGGQPPPQSRVPRLPSPNNGGIEPEKPVTAQELVVQTALPEGPHRGPVAGFLYFPYTGKSTSIKSLELLYEDAVLKLR